MRHKSRRSQGHGADSLGKQLNEKSSGWEVRRVTELNSTGGRRTKASLCGRAGRGVGGSSSSSYTWALGLGLQ